MNLSTEGKSLLKGVLILSVASALVGLFVVPAQGLATDNVLGLDLNLQLQVHNRISFALGVLLAAIASVVKVLMLERSINKAMDMEANKAHIYMSVSYLPRMILTGAVLVASAIFFGIFGIFGALAGTLSLTISVYIVRMFENRNKRQNSRGKE
ncbi:MAG: hypothetical protein FWB98_06925 [Defluviitaleaceae bacterium]|nr:hypothetical protein [Defluviitaleaceae bacterium]